MQLLIWVMCGALVLFIFVAAFIVDNCDYKINRLAKKRERSRQTDIDILEYKLTTKINSKEQRLCVNSIITKLAGKYVNFEIDQSGKVIVVLSKTDDEIGVMSAEELRVIGEEFIEAANYTENRNAKPFNVSFG